MCPPLLPSARQCCSSLWPTLALQYWEIPLLYFVITVIPLFLLLPLLSSIIIVISLFSHSVIIIRITVLLVADSRSAILENTLIFCYYCYLVILLLLLLPSVIIVIPLFCYSVIIRKTVFLVPDSRSAILENTVLVFCYYRYPVLLLLSLLSSVITVIPLFCHHSQDCAPYG